MQMFASDLLPMRAACTCHWPDVKECPACRAWRFKQRLPMREPRKVLGGIRGKLAQLRGQIAQEHQMLVDIEATVDAATNRQGKHAAGARARCQKDKLRRLRASMRELEERIAMIEECVALEHET